MTELRSQCPPCPWRDMGAMRAEWADVVHAAANGAWTECHTRCGPCDGPAYAGVRGVLR